MDEIKNIIEQHPIIFSFILLFLLMLPYFYQKTKTRSITKWRKHLNLDDHHRVFDELYQGVDGYGLSFQARQQLPEAIEYTYGEIEFLPFVALLSLVKPDNKTVFYDLGSGVGKAVLACAMVYPVRRAVGVELFSTLYASACAQVEKLANMPDYAKRAKDIHFIQGNFLEVVPSDATLIYINSTTIMGEVWEQLSAHIDTLPNVQAVITTTRPLSSTKFVPTTSTNLQMSWGVVMAHIHTRQT